MGEEDKQFMVLGIGESAVAVREQRNNVEYIESALMKCVRLQNI